MIGYPNRPFDLKNCKSMEQIGDRFRFEYDYISDIFPNHIYISKMTSSDWIEILEWANTQRFYRVWIFDKYNDLIPDEVKFMEL